MGFVQNGQSVGFGCSTDPLGFSLGARNNFAVLPVGLTADDGVRGKPRASIPPGYFLPFAFHAFEDGLLIASRKIDPFDANIDDLNPQAFEYGLLFVRPLPHVFEQLPGNCIERHFSSIDWRAFRIRHAE